MPKNKSQTINEQNRNAKFTARPNTLKSAKAKEYPPSLDNMPKDEV